MIIDKDYMNNNQKYQHNNRRRAKGTNNESIDNTSIDMSRNNSKIIFVV